MRGEAARGSQADAARRPGDDGDAPGGEGRVNGHRQLLQISSGLNSRLDFRLAPL